MQQSLMFAVHPSPKSKCSPLLGVSVREQTTVHGHCRDVADISSSVVQPASEKALPDAVLAAGTLSSDCAISSIKLNATFSLTLVTFLSHLSSPSPWVLPWSLSPSPRFYR